MKPQKFYADVREKREIMRDIYGGMMTVPDLKRELGYGSKTSVRGWLAEAGVEAVRVGRRVRYETDQVARAIVERRGMV